MLECPLCGQNVTNQERDKWFECEGCQKWICWHVNQSGAVWFEMAVIANGKIQPVQVARPSSQPQRAATGSTGSAQQPNVGQMDLQTVQSHLQRAESEINRMEAEIQRVNKLRNPINQNDPLIRQYNDELSRYTRKQNEWRQYKEQLIARKTAIEQQEHARQIGSSSGNSGLVFGCGTILVGAAIFAFTQWIGLYMDFRAYMILAFLAVVSGLLTLVIAQFN